MLVGGVLLSYFYSSNIDLFTVLGIYVAEQIFGNPSLSASTMPEPGEPRKTPQGVPYANLKYIVNADGFNLFCRYWEPEAPPRSVDDSSCLLMLSLRWRLPQQKHRHGLQRADEHLGGALSQSKL